VTLKSFRLELKNGDVAHFDVEEGIVTVTRWIGHVRILLIVDQKPIGDFLAEALEVST